MEKTTFGYKIKRANKRGFWLFQIDSKTIYTMQRGIRSGTWYVRKSMKAEPIAYAGTLRDAIIKALSLEGLLV